jgi:glycerophosphoryl diester phosphodiesterase
MRHFLALLGLAMLVFTAALIETMRTETILVHGHRGSRATRPENTLPAFEYAIQHGVDALELDLAVTKDNVLVVSHSSYITADYPGERVCAGPAVPPYTAIHTLTLTQLEQYDCGVHTLDAFPKQVAVPGTRTPTFEQVLGLAPQGNFDFNVETKIFPNHPELTPSPEEFVRMIDEAVKRHHLQSRVILQSFDFRTLRAMQQIDPSIRRSALFGNPKHDSLMGITDPDKDFVSLGHKSEATILSPDFEFVTPENVAAAHAAGLEVIPYTVNHPEDWQKMVDAKVDAIITDDPEALLGWLRARSLHP